ncbi:MAG: 3'(2'),5'-bisphosphate nucleotidase CysQ [Mycobacteriales bacterium]
MTSDGLLATELATSAGRLLLDVRRDLADQDPSVRKDEGDRRAHEHLAAALAQARPDDALLSEEGVDDPRRLGAERVWIVDPLDGTREFSELGRSDWAVHVALWQGGALVAGAVALPAQDRTFSTADPVRLPAAGTALRLVVSRTRAPTFVVRLAERLGAELVPMGSAGAKAMSLLQGHADAYVHGGGMYEWDSAAPVAVARAAGLHTSRLDGSALCYNQPDPLLPDLLICRPELASVLLAAVAASAC